MRDKTLLDRFGIQASLFEDEPTAVLDSESGFDLGSDFGESPGGGSFPIGDPAFEKSNPIGDPPLGDGSSPIDDPASPENPPSESPSPFKPPREVIRLIVGLIAAAMARISAVWHCLDPDDDFLDRVDLAAKAALRPPYTREKLDGFKALLAEWETFELDRVKRWIEEARAKTDGWSNAQCRMCEFRIGELTKGGLRPEKAIQIAFCELCEN